MKKSFDGWFGIFTIQFDLFNPGGKSPGNVVCEALSNTELNEIINESLHKLWHLLNELIFVLDEIFGMMITVDGLHDRVHGHTRILV